MKEQLEDCGYWYVAGAKKEALEYTTSDEVRGYLGEHAFLSYLCRCVPGHVWSRMGTLFVVMWTGNGTRFAFTYFVI